MQHLLDLIVRTTKIVVDLDTIVEKAARLAEDDPELRFDAEVLGAAAASVRERLIETLDEVRPRDPALTSRATRHRGTTAELEVGGMTNDHALHRCPKCGGTIVHRDRRTPMERFVVRKVRPYLCLECHHRFFDVPTGEGGARWSGVRPGRKNRAS